MSEQRQPPPTETMNASEARQQFSAVVNKVYRGETRVLVEKSGIPVAAIVSVEDLRRLKQWDEELAARRQLLADMRAPFKDVPAEEIERESAKALAQARAELRAERALAATAK